MEKFVNNESMTITFHILNVHEELVRHAKVSPNPIFCRRHAAEYMQHIIYSTSPKLQSGVLLLKVKVKVKDTILRYSHIEF